MITKAVFPVAGLGTRFLPATKASSKEMLPVVDKPLIQYAVEEAVAAGITQMVFITGRNKRAIEDHFDKAYELETELQVRGKLQMLEQVQNIVPKHVSCIYVRQTEALGLGHAILCARPVVGDEPFAVILADDLIDGNPPVMKQMVDVYARERCSLLAVQTVAREETSKLWHRQDRAGRTRHASHHRHRREAAAGERAFQSGGGRALCTDAGDLRSPREGQTRHERRDPTDRRHRLAPPATNARWHTSSRACATIAGPSSATFRRTCCTRCAIPRSARIFPHFSIRWLQESKKPRSNAG